MIFLRNCNFKPLKYLEDNYDEGTKNFSVFTLLRNNRIDLSGYPLQIGLTELFLEPSKVFNSER